MRISEAMRLGSMLHPQGFGGLKSVFRRNWLARDTFTCALGAAFEAIGCEYRYAEPGIVGILIEDNWLSVRFAAVPDDWYKFLQEQVTCRVCGDGKEFKMYQLIGHLNDYHYWTRQRIADFVESREIALEAMAVSGKTEVCTSVKGECKNG